MKTFVSTLIAFLMCTGVWAQLSSADVKNGKTPVTWLGIDFSQLKFMGTATHFKETPDVSSEQLIARYFPAWNELILKEPKKYNVAAAAQRNRVKYAVDVTDKSNTGLKEDFFSDNPEDFRRLKKSNIAALVKEYDFQGNKGMGMMIFVESMSKDREAALMWIAFVDMDHKELLLAKRLSAKPAGFGFRNYWARTFSEVLKATASDLPEWK